MLRMTSIDSGIEAECESNDCTDHSSACHNTSNMSVVPFTSSNNTDSNLNFIPDSFCCSSNIMAQPSTSTSGSSSESFHSLFEMDYPQIVIVGYNDDRAPHKVIRDEFKIRRKFYLRNRSGDHISRYHPPSMSVRSGAPTMVKRRSYQWPYFHTGSKLLIQVSFHSAASTNNSEKLLSMIMRGVDPNIKDEFNRTALHKAACKGYTDSVRVLLENGANPNLRDNVGNTALHLAACTNHIDVITLLLKHDCDASSTDFSGRSPLQLAQSKLKILAKSSCSSVDSLKSEILKVIDMLLLFIERKKSPGKSLLCERAALLTLCNELEPTSSTSGLIKPATLTLNSSPVPQLSFDQGGKSTGETNNNTSSPVRCVTFPGATSNGLDADIELLNLFQTRMKLSENVEGDLSDLMDNLDKLKIASIDASKPQG